KFFGAWHHTVTGYIASHRGALDAARAEFEIAIALCDQVGDPMTRWLAVCWLGEVSALAGDFDDARARFEQILRRGYASDGDLARHWTIPDLGRLLLGL